MITFSEFLKAYTQMNIRYVMILTISTPSSSMYATTNSRQWSKCSVNNVMQNSSRHMSCSCMDLMKHSISITHYPLTWLEMVQKMGISYHSSSWSRCGLIPNSMRDAKLQHLDLSWKVISQVGSQSANLGVISLPCPQPTQLLRMMNVFS